MNALPPCVLHEDEHLLVVNKPPGFNTHAPSPYAGEGIYDWLRHRRPEWASLATIHRLDKETSGVMVFSKSPLANRSLTTQFASHSIHKAYVLLTDRPLPPALLSPSPSGTGARSPAQAPGINAASTLVRSGDRYVSRPLLPGAERAETHFTLLSQAGRQSLVLAEPVTGRTHQIRVHAAEHGFPILGDTLYGGTPATRLHLHARALRLRHPATQEECVFKADPDFAANPHVALRRAIINPAETNAFRILHGAADDCPGWYVDRLGPHLLSQGESPLADHQLRELYGLGQIPWLGGPQAPHGIYHKTLSRTVRHSHPAEASPKYVQGPLALERFAVSENGVQFLLSFEEGYSVGLFLDQRDNRHRLLTGHVAAGFPLFASATPPGESRTLLNVFAYTCGFSVCAALGGMRTTSLDLSKKYLEWGRDNFRANGLDLSRHDFIYGDAFEWLRRLAKKGRLFDVIVLDPPTFSQSRESGVFRADKDFGRLVSSALPLLKPGGVALLSTNAAELEPERFLHALHGAAAQAGRKILLTHYQPQPPDFPRTRLEPAYLKTVWIRVA